MEPSPFSRTHVQALVSAAQEDSALVAVLKAERTALAVAIATDPAAAREIVSGSGNGANYSAEVQYTKAQRLDLLQRVLAALGEVPAEAAAAGGGRAYASFR